MSDEKRNDPALQWAAERAGLTYNRFVRDLTPETIARIGKAHANRFLYDSPTPNPEQAAAEREQVQRTRIRRVFHEKWHSLPREIQPLEYARFLAEIDVTTKAERAMLEAAVKEEIAEAKLLANRTKLNHFLWWLGGQ